MDIDDLLAEVAIDSTPQEIRDLQELTRYWVAERVAPEILPWPSELMDRVLERTRKQVGLYEERKRQGHEVLMAQPD
jgi:GINS complex subunit 4